MVVDGAKQAPHTFIHGFPVPGDVRGRSHRRAERDATSAPDVARAGAKLVGDADQRACARGREAAPLFIKLSLGDVRQGEVVVAGRQGARDGIVECAVEAAVRIGRGYDGVELNMV